MPGGDGTGPGGLGPMTGRGLGDCAGYAVQNYPNPGFGRGFGRGFGGGLGRGGGRGWRNQFYATGLPGWQRGAMQYPAYAPGYGVAPIAPTLTKEQQVETLKDQVQYFEDTLDGIRKRIEELEAKGT